MCWFTKLHSNLLLNLLHAYYWPIVDADGVLGAMPKGDWEDVCQSAVEAIEEGRGRLRFASTQEDNHCGRFSALTAGISHGGGQAA